MVLTKATLRVNVEASDWQDAIRQVGCLLVADGAVTEAYIQAMIRAVEVKGPYIVVTKGVAVPHTGPDYVSRVALGVVRLKTPVVFGHTENDPVDLLFCLCSPDYMSHIPTLISMTNLLENVGALTELRDAPDDEAALRILERAM